MAKNVAAYMGMEKEAPSLNGGSGSSGKKPVVHSHSLRPKRTIKLGGKRGKRAM